MDKTAIRYSAKRAYFGKLTGAGLTTAYGQIKHTHDWDKPVTSANVTVGHIDGTVICRALWYEMSYNPARFGQVSPFLYKGKENIYRFCDSPVPEDTPGYEILENLRHKMIDFMTLNGRYIGKWQDYIDAPHGVVRISLVDGHSDDNYKVLTKLREMIRIIISQNLKDSDRKSYGAAMQAVIRERHPNGIRGNPQVDSMGVLAQKSGAEPRKQNSTFMPLSVMPETRDWDSEAERDVITVDNYQYVPAGQYRQACADLATYYDNLLQPNGM